MNNYTHTEQVGIVAYVVLSHMNNYTHTEQVGIVAYVVLSHMNNYTEKERERAQSTRNECRLA